MPRRAGLWLLGGGPDSRQIEPFGPFLTLSGHWQCLVANLGVRCHEAPGGRLLQREGIRDIAVTHRHLLLLALLLAPARRGTRRGRRSATGATLRARAVPETAGGRSAGQSELRLPRRAGKSQPADRSHNSAHGREIPCALTGEAGRSRCLSGRRAGRHRPPGGQWAHRCRFHPRPGHRGGEPARHHVLGAGAYLRVHRRLRQRASRPPLLFRGNRARPFGGDGSLPPGPRRHRRRP